MSKKISGSGSLRILIVDDHQEMVEILAQAVEMLGYQPFVATSGEEALARMSHTAPDVILLDLMMPEVDGYETLRRIRRLPEAEHISVIVVTASEDKDLPRLVAEAGGNGCLRKPVDLEALSEMIAEMTAGSSIPDPLSAGLLAGDESEEPLATPIRPGKS